MLSFDFASHGQGRVWNRLGPWLACVAASLSTSCTLAGLAIGSTVTREASPMSGSAVTTIPRGTEIEVVYRRAPADPAPVGSAPERELGVATGTLWGRENHSIVLEHAPIISSQDGFVGNAQSDSKPTRTTVPLDQVLLIRTRTSSYALADALAGAALDVVVIGSFFIVASQVGE